MRDAGLVESRLLVAARQIPRGHELTRAITTHAREKRLQEGGWALRSRFGTASLWMSITAFWLRVVPFVERQRTWC
jgi:hypothetical protein